MVPECVPDADVAFGNDAFSVPVPVPDILPDPYVALTLKVIEVPDILPFVILMLYVPMPAAYPVQPEPVKFPELSTVSVACPNCVSVIFQVWKTESAALLHSGLGAALTSLDNPTIAKIATSASPKSLEDVFIKRA